MSKRLQKKRFKRRLNAFNILLKSNRGLIQSIAVKNPVISKNDEWNDPIYDKYARVNIN